MGRTKCSEAGALVLKRGGRKDLRSIQNSSIRSNLDGLREAPWRKTPSIFKQPVTLVHTTSRETQKTPGDLPKRLSTVQREREDMGKPRQIFWAKSLESLCAMIPPNLADKVYEERDQYHIGQQLALPPKIELVVSSVSEEAATATLISALQYNFDEGLVGQQATKKQIEDNPLSALLFSQPFVQIPIVTEQDILAEEKRVLDARKRLQELRKSFITR